MPEQYEALLSRQLAEHQQSIRAIDIAARANGAPSEFANLLASARTAMGFAAGGTGVHSKRAAVSGTVRLLDAMPAFGDEALTYERRFTARPSGAVFDLLGAIRAASVVCGLGAQIVPLKSNPESVADSKGTAATYVRRAEFKVIEAADFQEIAEHADIPASDIPVLSAKIDNLGTVPTHAARFVLERSEQRDMRDSELEAITSHAIALGLGRIADRVLLQKIVSASPGAYSIGALAAKGLRAQEVKALVGTDGDGAAYVQGSLYVAGVDALLTPEMAPTIIGAWQRAAIAMEDEVTVICNRMNAAGRLEITVIAAVDALLPDSAAFWTFA